MGFNAMEASLIKAAGIFPLNREIRMGQAYLHASLRDNRISTRSVQAIEKAIESNPYAADLWFNLAAIKHFSGNAEGASTALARAKSLAPKSAFLNEIP